MAKPNSKSIMYDGITLGLWKSTAIKSLRMGWPAGLAAVAERIPKGKMEYALLCSIWEDVFPATEEIPQVLTEIRRGEWEKLCSRDTHHGRGYTDRFCELEDQAVRAAENEKELIWAEAKKFKVWLPPRSLNCFWTWREIMPNDPGKKRQTDQTPWDGMPRAMADAHTREGKELGIDVTVLSGHYHNHKKLARRVQMEGWDEIRQEVHSDPLTAQV